MDHSDDTPGLGGGYADVYPFDIAGATFEGLAYQSTLQATVKYYFERIPAITEPDLLALTQVAPAFDPVALELYSRALSLMPVGVTIDENPFGEWFSDILSTFQSIGPKIGGMLHTVGNALGANQAAIQQANYPLTNTPMVRRPPRPKRVPPRPPPKPARLRAKAIKKKPKPLPKPPVKKK